MLRAAIAPPIISQLVHPLALISRTTGVQLSPFLLGGLRLLYRTSLLRKEMGTRGGRQLSCIILRGLFLAGGLTKIQSEVSYGSVFAGADSREFPFVGTS